MTVRRPDALSIDEVIMLNDRYMAATVGVQSEGQYALRLIDLDTGTSSIIQRHYYSDTVLPITIAAAAR